MNRKQIEGLRSYISSVAGAGINLIMAGVNMDELLYTALNSIPRKFDSEDETTWPEKDGEYLVWCDYSKCPNPYEEHLVRQDQWIDGALNMNTTARGKRWLHSIGVATHYMPIPEAGEEK